MTDFLLELRSEEIPARMQVKATDDLARLFADEIAKAGLTASAVETLATPRRLALIARGLPDATESVSEERKGPRSNAPEQALAGFLRSTGLTREQLIERDGVFFAVIDKPGRSTADVLAEAVPAVVRAFPWPKSMRWGDASLSTESLRWVRPLQGIVALFGDNVVPFEIDGIASGAATMGHRFHHSGPITIGNASDYVEKLRACHVIVHLSERTTLIRDGARAAAAAEGLVLVEDEGLVVENAGLTEWPVPLLGRFDPAFLDVPREVIQLTMRTNQKYFACTDASGALANAFVCTANIDASDGGTAIVAGNGKVLTARLSDAKFFWENDLRVAKAGMGEWLDGLKAVTFHNKLGSQADRVERIAALAREIAPMVGADPDLAEQAAKVAKADLRSQMVGEFPELQGLMGRYYATAAAMPAEVAAASEEHYSPLGPTDDVPTAPVSVAVALADKIDTLTGFWAIDEKPTGSKDPFALRRAALGVTRSMLVSGVRAELCQILDLAHANILSSYRKKHSLFFRSSTGSFRLAMDMNLAMKEPASERAYWWGGRSAIADTSTDLADHLLRHSTQKMFDEDEHFYIFESEVTTPDLLSFLHDRLKVFLRDEGVPHDVIDACLAMPGNDDLTLLVNRARALAAFLKTDDGTNLLQGFKRANNILTQAEEKDGVEYSYGADVKYAEYPEEVALFAALDAAEATIAPAMTAEDFGAAMRAMASLRAPIDAFFTVAQVNSDKQVIRRNRLNLLSRIRAICQSVADLTKVDG